ncbi:hypothetical protein RCM47_17050 [Escherichia coli]|nr:hypothetical protein [Escherichia coli]
MSKFSFGHLLGLGGSRAAEEPDDNRGSKAEEDEDLRKSKKAENDEDDQKESKAENDDDDQKESKADNEDDNDDPDVSEDDEEEKARASERNRCAAIFASEHAAVNPALAAELAFNTRLSVSQALKIMKSSVAGNARSRGGLAARMQQSTVRPDTGRDIRRAPTGVHALAQEAMALYNEANGGKKV